ncbi:unnamed protein product [Arabis nemorensis]|uniref:Uncharacterized protein n=1 Tax=Arabis nemorensis TaxID=586526 RepID=A0A565BPV8_9BRAS|nr:unnamed protein product [Arabis nemorensis]
MSQASFGVRASLIRCKKSSSTAMVKAYMALPALTFHFFKVSESPTSLCGTTSGRTGVEVEVSEVVSVLLASLGGVVSAPFMISHKSCPSK